MESTNEPMGPSFETSIPWVYAAAMARPFRIESPGAIYHVTSGGNARQAIYTDDADRTAGAVRASEAGSSF